MTIRLLVATLILALLGCGTTTRPGTVGADRKQFLLVPAATVENAAMLSYNNQYQKAKASGRLVESGPDFERLKVIGTRLITQTPVFRDDVKQWKWRFVLIDAPVLNATCAPGGKVTFFTGLIRKLNLSDAEIAAVMGHEIAHALREHGREQVSEAMGQQLLVSADAAGTKSPEQTAAIANQIGEILFRLPHSREKEIEADKLVLS